MNDYSGKLNMEKETKNIHMKRAMRKVFSHREMIKSCEFHMAIKNKL